MPSASTSRGRSPNISRKAALESQFVELLGELQPSPAFMRLVKEYILTACRTRREESRSEAVAAERRSRTIQERLDRLDDAFLFAQTIDHETYERQRNRLREDLALARVDRNATLIDEIDIEGVLAFAEEVLPSASKLWTHASLDQRQRLQQVFFPEGIRYGRDGFNRTAVTVPLFSRLAPAARTNARMVGAGGIEPPTPRV